MLKNYSLDMLLVFLALGLAGGLAFPFLLPFLVELPEEDLSLLRLGSVSIGLLMGAANFCVYYFFIRYIIGHFRETLSRVRSEDYNARVGFSSRDMLGLLAADVNDTLSHLEEKNAEVLHDDLTGLPNRQFLKQLYRKKGNRLAHQKTAFLFFDLDKFKEINDQFGHLYGDRVLVEVSNRVRSGLAENEVLVRLSGDEFLLVAGLSEGCTGQDLAEQLIACFIEPFDIHGTLLQVETSIGVSMAPIHGINLGELIRKADFAMYEAKQTAGNSYHLFSELHVMEMGQPVESC